MEERKLPEKVHSQMVRAGAKNYFFDVKKASNGSHYLTVAESYKNKSGEKIINRIMLFKDHMTAFSSALAEVESYM